MEDNLMKSGLLVPGRYNLNDLIKELKKGDIPISIQYDKTKGIVTIEDDDTYYRIHLNLEHRFKYENDISDPQLDKIRNLEQFIHNRQLEKQQLEIERRIAIEVGASPVLRASGMLEYYSKFLDDEIAKNKKIVVAKSFNAFWPLLVLAPSATAFTTFLLNQLSYAAIPAGLISCGALIVGVKKLIFDRKEYLTSMRELLKKIKILSLKKVDLSSSSASANKALSKENSDTTIIDAKKDYMANIIKFEKNVEGELDAVLYLIGKLPLEEQEVYITKTKELILLYKRITLNAKVDNQKFANTNSIPDYNFDLKSALSKLRSILEERIKELKVATFIDKNADSMILAAERISNPGWTDALIEKESSKTMA